MLPLVGCDPGRSPPPDCLILGSEYMHAGPVAQVPGSTDSAAAVTGHGTQRPVVSGLTPTHRIVQETGAGTEQSGSQGPHSQLPRRREPKRAGWAAHALVSQLLLLSAALQIGLQVAAHLPLRVGSGQGAAHPAPHLQPRPGCGRSCPRWLRFYTDPIRPVTEGGGWRQDAAHTLRPSSAHWKNHCKSEGPPTPHPTLKTYFPIILYF